MGLTCRVVEISYHTWMVMEQCIIAASIAYSQSRDVSGEHFGFSMEEYNILLGLHSITEFIDEAQPRS